MGGKEQPRVGDTWEGVGGMKVRVRIDKIGENSSDVTLVRSGNKKTLKNATLAASYRLLERPK